MNDTAQQVSPKATLSAPRYLWRALVLFVLLLAVGAAFRLWELPEQSLWGDEYLGGTAYLNAPSLGQHLRLLHAMGPENAPVYASVQYGWAKLLNQDPLTLRFLPFFFSFASLAILFLMAYRLAGLWGACLATLLMAASPAQIWYAQALRPYSLVCFLSLLSMATFLAARSGRSLAWIVCLFANIVLIWTHHLYALLVVMEMLYLLPSLFRKEKAACLWFLVQGLLLLPLLVYLAQLRPLNLEHKMILEGADYWRAFAGDGSYVLGAGKPAIFAGLDLSWQTLLQSVQRGILLSLEVLLACTSLMLLVYVWRRRTILGTFSRPQRDGMGFFAILIVLPFLLLSLLAMATGKPFLLPRYLYYATFAQYLALGMLLSQFPTGIQKATVALLGVLLLFSGSFFATDTSRTPWRSVAQRIQQEVGAKDMILTRHFFHGQLLLENGPDFQVPLVSARNIYTTCDAAILCCTQQCDVGEDAPSLWVVHNQNWNGNPSFALEQAWEALGLSWEREEYPGWEGLSLYRVQAPAPPKARAVIPRPKIAHDVADILAACGAAQGLTASDEALQAFLARFLNDEAPDDMIVFLEWSYGLAFTQWGYPVLGESVAQAAVEVLGDESSYFTLGIARYAQGDLSGAEEAFRNFQENATYATLLDPLIGAMLRDDREAVRHEVRDLVHQGYFFGVPLRLVLDKICDSAYTTPLGLYPIREKDIAAVAQLLEASRDAERMNPAMAQRLSEELALAGFEQEALQWDPNPPAIEALCRSAREWKSLRACP